jgi:hypothetical protein
LPSYARPVSTTPAVTPRSWSHASVNPSRLRPELVSHRNQDTDAELAAVPLEPHEWHYNITAQSDLASARSKVVVIVPAPTSYATRRPAGLRRCCGRCRYRRKARICLKQAGIQRNNRAKVPIISRGQLRVEIIWTAPSANKSSIERPRSISEYLLSCEGKRIRAHVDLVAPDAGRSNPKYVVALRPKRDRLTTRLCSPPSPSLHIQRSRRPSPADHGPSVRSQWGRLYDNGVRDEDRTLTPRHLVPARGHGQFVGCGPCGS